MTRAAATRGAQTGQRSNVHPIPQKRSSYLRTGRSLRKPGRVAGQRKNRIPDMVNIAERPPEPTSAVCPATGKAIC